MPCCRLPSHYHKHTQQADEELLLLEAIDNSGLGNWTAVAEATGSKSEAECRRHYYSVYVEHDKFPQPEPEAEMAGVRGADGNGHVHSATTRVPQIKPEDYVHSVAKFEQLATRFASKSTQKRAEADAGGGYVTAVRNGVGCTLVEGADNDNDDDNVRVFRMRNQLQPGGAGEGGAVVVLDAAVGVAVVVVAVVARTTTTNTAWRRWTMQALLVCSTFACRTTYCTLRHCCTLFCTATAVSAAEGGMELDGPDRDSDAQEFLDAEEDLAGGQEGKGARRGTAQGGGKHVSGAKGAPKVKQEDGEQTGQAAHPMAGGKTLRSDNTQAPAAVKVGASLVEITTFNIRRNEFEHEYDNEAELLIGRGLCLDIMCLDYCI